MTQEEVKNPVWTRRWFRNNSEKEVRWKPKWRSGFPLSGSPPSVLSKSCSAAPHSFIELSLISSAQTSLPLKSLGEYLTFTCMTCSWLICVCWSYSISVLKVGTVVYLRYVCWTLSQHRHQCIWIVGYFKLVLKLSVMKDRLLNKKNVIDTSYNDIEAMSNYCTIF